MKRPYLRTLLRASAGRSSSMPSTTPTIAAAATTPSLQQHIEQTKPLLSTTTAHTATEDGDELWTAIFGVLLLCGWLVWIVLCGVLLVQDSTPQVQFLCGNLWTYMEARTACFAIELLLLLVQLFFLSPSSSSTTGMTSLEEDEEGCAGLCGSSPVARWWGWFAHFVYSLVFAIISIAVLPAALIDHTPCCLNALGASSFTGTYTLAIFAWMYLVLDIVQASALGMWLVQTHAASGAHSTAV